MYRLTYGMSILGGIRFFLMHLVCALGAVSSSLAVGQEPVIATPAINAWLSAVFPKQSEVDHFSASLNQGELKSENYDELHDELLMGRRVYNETYVWVRDYLPIESYLLADYQLDYLGAHELQRLSYLTKCVLTEMDASSMGLLQKAYLQRDFLHLFCAISKSMRVGDASLGESQIMGVIAVDLARLIQLTALSPGEFRDLGGLLKQKTKADYFVKDTSPFLRAGRLKNVLCGDYTGLYEFDFSERPSAHYDAFEGRSFIRTFFDLPSDFQSDLLWARVRRSLADSKGDVIDAVFPEMPEEMTFLLLRNFGILLSDGEYVDSGIVEEVIIRSNKHAKSKFDRTTHDFRGNYYYQYKSARELLLDPQNTTAGLYEVKLFDAQYPGFFESAVDLQADMSPRGQATTMLYNCMTCHGTATYGFNTIFSLQRTDKIIDRTTINDEVSSNANDGSMPVGFNAFRHLQLVLANMAAEQEL